MPSILPRTNRTSVHHHTRPGTTTPETHIKSQAITRFIETLQNSISEEFKTFI
ncbi:hypothetical protein [Streptomyces sp. NBC_01565]|uniref:hypothetical protein n=1 Tax=Streptomyces sp. NBC_01565 TaxID=2975881 RepID=UPI002250A498|nr:hypothetical protein [Streptomyces sp. NBC_01565]MCX4547243.1 hypothetical protein [Streptomyces sp. NBC_01565]